MKQLLLLFVLLPVLVQAQTITTVTGNGAKGYTGDGGPASAAQIEAPIGIAYDAAGNLYIDGNESDVIRKISPAGIITAFSATTGGYSGDGGAASVAKFSGPQGMSFDKYGNMYIADGDNHVIRKINTLGIVSTVAGNGTPGYSGDNGIATNAQLNTPSDVKADDAGNIYIAEFKNNVVRKVNTLGIITTIAGNNIAGYSGDGGPATAAQMNWPGGIALDGAGNLYIGDYTNQVVRMVNTKDTISTVVGMPGGGSSGDGGPATAARLHGPWGVSFDSSGNLLIVDTYNNKIRKVTAGIISTVAGNGFGSSSSTGGYAGDKGAATAAELYWPAFVAIGPAGSFYISDEGNYAIRKVDTSTPKSTLGEQPLSVTSGYTSLLPNPNSGVFRIKGFMSRVNNEDILVDVSNMLGEIVFKTTIPVDKGAYNAELSLREGLPAGMYVLQLRSGTENKIVHFVIDR